MEKKPQIDLFSQVMAQIFQAPQKLSDACKDVAGYLSKGERLLSLAKDQYSKQTELSVSDLEEKILKSDKFGTAYDKNREVVAKVFRSLLGNVKSEDEDPEENEGVKKIYEVLGNRYNVKITKPVSLYRAGDAYRSWYGKVLLTLTLLEEHNGNTYVMQVESPAGVRMPQNKLRRWRSIDISIYDMAYILADLYILKLVSDFLLKELNVDDGLVKWFKEGRVVEYIYGEEADRFCIFNYTNRDGSRLFSSADIERLNGYLGDKKLRIYECHSQDVESKNYEGYEVIPRSYLDWMDSLSDIRNQLKENGRLGYIRTLVGLGNGAPHSVCVWKNNKRELINAIRRQPHLDYDVRKFISKMFLMAADVVRTEIKTRTYWSERVGLSKAKAYETKKGIPQKTVEAMEKSGFNKYFGYVEYDESTDLKKAEELFKEFDAVMQTHFPAIKMQDNSLRFRKILNHKATGLYYPHVKCLVVDVREPASFMHEFGHLIDHKYENLSHGGRFYSIRQIYKDLIEKAIKDDDGAKSQWSGSTKYNKDYYLEPTEVFARSFELYCYTVLGIQNSLLKTADDGFEKFCYPQDECYMKAVKEYFDELFDIISEKESGKGKEEA